MSKQLTRKKKIDPPQTVVQSPTKLPRINPHTCLLANTFKLQYGYGRSCLIVKRQYYKKLELTSDYWSAARTDQRVQRLYPKMKFVRSFEIKNSSSKTYTRFFKKMRRFSKAKMKLNLKSTPSDIYQSLIANLKPLTRLNLTSLEIRMESLNGGGPELESLILSILMRSLRYMSNLKVFSCIMEKFGDLRVDIPNYLLIPVRKTILNDKKIVSKFKRLQKIQELNLCHLVMPIKILYILTEGLECLPNLKIVKLKSIDPAHGKELIERLCKVQTLTSVILHPHFEPNDILSLTIKVPSLKSITIKNDWIFTSKDMPSLTTIGHKGLEVTRLRMKLPLDIDSDEDAEFVASFLSVFSQLRTLSLHMRTIEEGALLIPIGKQISRLSQLEQLDLGVSIRSDGIHIPFLSSIVGLKDLKRISLTLKTESIYGWDIYSMDIYNALKPLLQSKVLQKVSLNWNQFTPQCAECLKLVINELKSLDSFHLRYTPVSDTSDYKIYKNQEKILSVFGNLFGRTDTIIKEVVIITVGETTRKMEKTDKAAKSNNNIKKFMLTMLPVGNTFRSIV